jgi:hypothetical protein
VRYPNAIVVGHERGNDGRDHEEHRRLVHMIATEREKKEQDRPEFQSDAEEEILE